MLRTALKLRWILALLAALAVSGVFVLLSQWQFSRSTSDSPPVVPTVETPQPLTKTIQPGAAFPAAAADQMVTASGHYDPSRQALVPNRLRNGVSGWWVVTAFVVDGAPAVGGEKGIVVPVARGWLADPGNAGPPPSGEVQLTGRLLPSEAPQANKHPAAGQASMVSVAELINLWDVQSYPGFVSATHEVTTGGDQSASALHGTLEPLDIAAQPATAPVNWLNIFYAVEWVVFAGFSIFLWWRLVRDDYERRLEAQANDGAQAHDGAPDAHASGTEAPEASDAQATPAPEPDDTDARSDTGGKL
ncbi:SURF1 family protein [Sinomonas sp. ASV322]|uniref:SURF1 family protein n=1 Tax=Sinomonas sp. ASV322 TaxID=3041920 RepID=UPI0027DCEE21|nr:SURF1 family protein [Sinomonas sp. ASV322]MDQ4501949.1 SURF1 family protein [Sinomonas sp. ASV322]